MHVPEIQEYTILSSSVVRVHYNAAFAARPQRSPTRTNDGGFSSQENEAETKNKNRATSPPPSPARKKRRAQAQNTDGHTSREAKPPLGDGDATKVLLRTANDTNIGF